MPLQHTVKGPKKIRPRLLSQGKGSSRAQETDNARMYRDRAAERRKGGAGDYADTTQLLGHLDPHDRVAAYEQSKYLGGTPSHTHLVKGLDFLLLDKVRNNATDTEIEKEEEKAISAVGRQVVAGMQWICQMRQVRRHSNANDLFAPGRMCHEIQVATNGAVRATTRIRSLEEAQAVAADKSNCDRVVLAKVVAAIAAGHHRRTEAKYLQRQYADKPPTPNEPPAAVVEEEDIFADAGVDYPEMDDEGVTAPYPEMENEEEEAVTAPYPESDNEGVTAPYPEMEDKGVTIPPEEDEMDDALLFSLAKSRFKEETGALLTQQPKERDAKPGKRKAATLESNAWAKTQRLLEIKKEKK
ncbi:hypothetical protein GGI20_003517 [Coemansia sp. BCRC 34301]|nr:hypothetical protein GGI20_003517 [Coemansia sp. BCRC 34301]